MKDRSKLATEKRNARSRDIDRRSTLEIVDLINAEDADGPRGGHGLVPAPGNEACP